MALKIMPHGRLQEWVAEEKGYFTAEGLEYSFVHSEDSVPRTWRGSRSGSAITRGATSLPCRPGGRAAAR